MGRRQGSVLLRVYTFWYQPFSFNHLTFKQDKFRIQKRDTRARLAAFFIIKQAEYLSQEYFPRLHCPSILHRIDFQLELSQ